MISSNKDKICALIGFIFPKHKIEFCMDVNFPLDEFLETMIKKESAF